MIEEMPTSLDKIIRNGEGLTTEFKEAKRSLPKNLFETICSMLNRFGGHIFLGICDDGAIHGVEPGYVKTIRQDFANLCNNPEKIFPTVHLEIKEYLKDSKHVLHIFVNESSNVHRVNGRIYNRNEDGDFDVTRDTAQVATLYLNKQNTYTENRIFPYADTKALRSDLIERARRMATTKTPNHQWGTMNDLELLRSAGLYGQNLASGEEGLNLAGILLFGSDDLIRSAISYYRTDALLRVDDTERYDDRDDIRTNLFEAYDRLMAFMRKHLDDRFVLVGTQRISVRDTIARELSVNMLIHREYANPLPARLIIGEQTVCTENASKPRMIGYIDPSTCTPFPKNPKIASMFNEVGLADELGSGIKKIVTYTQLYGWGVPNFQEGDSFVAELPRYPGKVNTVPQSEVVKLVINFIREHPNTNRASIDIMLSSKMRSMAPQEISRIASNAINSLSRRGKIINEGSRISPQWRIVDTE